ncbi:Zinc finger and SCAN domain-containing protein 5B, partial [Stegodyphus mimosarum]
MIISYCFCLVTDNLWDHVCLVCNRVFSSNKAVIEHQKSGHKMEGILVQYRCSLCSYTSRWLHNIRRHSKIHTGEKPYSCEICGRKFSSSSSFKYHKVTNCGGRIFKCGICAQTFQHKDQLSVHYQHHT